MDKIQEVIKKEVGKVYDPEISIRVGQVERGLCSPRSAYITEILLGEKEILNKVWESPEAKEAIEGLTDNYKQTLQKQIEAAVQAKKIELKNILKESK